MKTLLNITLLLAIKTVVFAQTINFQSATPTYPNGAFSHTFTSANTPVSINASGSGFANSPGGPTPRPSGNGLYCYMNYSSNTESATITISFATTVLGLTFNVFDIDRGAVNPDGITYNNVDQVTISAVNAKGVTQTPSIGGNAYTTVSGNTITGIASAPSNSTNSVSLAGPISSVSITYTNGAGSQADPTFQTITIGTLSWGALPVSMYNFQGKNIDNQVVELFWQMSVEQENKQIFVERSSDLEYFTKIGSNKMILFLSQNEYQFTDFQPQNGINYYRLKQENTEGITWISRTISVVLAKEEMLNIFPNPTDGQVFFVENINTNTSLKLRNIAGIEQPLEQIFTENKRQIKPSQPLCSGVYFLIVENEERKISRLLVVK